MELAEVGTLARHYMDKYGLTGAGWLFRFDGAKRRLGAAKILANGTKIISVSAPYARMNDVEVVRDTIIHECTHALVGLKHGHDAVWNAKNRQLLDDEGLHHIEVSAKNKLEIGRPDARYVATCGTCGHQFNRHRLTPRVANKQLACHKCCNSFNGGRFHEKYALSFVDTLGTSSEVRYSRPMTTTRKCQDCKSRPIDTDTQGRDSTFCTVCYDYAGWGNTHSDEGHEILEDPSSQTLAEMEECPVCHPELDVRFAPVPTRKGTRNKNASGPQFSHASCAHAKTKSARAKCRRERAQEQ